MGYHYSAKLYSRVKDTFKLVALTTLTVCVTATALIESAPLVFVRMFGSGGGELIPLSLSAACASTCL